MDWLSTPMVVLLVLTVPTLPSALRALNRMSTACALLSLPMPRKSTLPAAALVRLETLNSVPLLIVPFTSTV